MADAMFTRSPGSHRKPTEDNAGDRARGVPVRHLLGATALLVGPTVIALNVFVFFGDLSPLLALWLVLIATLTAAAGVLYFYRDIVQVARYAGALSRSSEQRITPPHPGSNLLRDLVAGNASPDR